jgi:hypothetical protein
MQKSIDHDVEEYHYTPSCFDGIDWPNYEWDAIEYTAYAEISGFNTMEVATARRL